MRKTRQVEGSAGKAGGNLPGGPSGRLQRGAAMARQIPARVDTLAILPNTVESVGEDVRAKSKPNRKFGLTGGNHEF